MNGLLTEQFPAFAEEVEFWHVDDAPDTQAGPWQFVEPGGPESLDGAIIDGRAVSCQVRLFGGNVEAGEERAAFVGDEVHDVAFPFLADELEDQEGGHGFLGGDHGGAGQPGLTNHFVQAQVAQARHDDEQTAQPRAESAWLAIKGAAGC